MLTRNPLRRTVLGAAATVSGIVLLLALKPHSAPAPALAHATAPTSPPTSSAGAPSTGAPSKGGTAPAKRTGTVTGSTVQTDYGPVQVQATFANGRITGVTALQTPSDNPRDQEIASYAVPQLTREAIAAQSAHIDAVSGASYTSAGYIQSLQSALDRAGG
ncbi:FMN-binding protein [Streptantibioticus ferralitis]|uniref:FMN-binding protein n=1 Tax=Streptantibioticus ferralitis TaxID=236510 RepID=A0ABT5Z6U1_9ACTN|nr:FMN-binding protein [Streptantibioticus ferralitis]MDF2259555.1 FMN-binding protein [Streptantibioticus ferralitis]